MVKRDDKDKEETMQTHNHHTLQVGNCNRVVVNIYTHSAVVTLRENTTNHFSVAVFPCEHKTAGVAFKLRECKARNSVLLNHT